MLDVHPAHHAASSWRDFFIHIATIVIGLLIAVGLEQAVEWVHHRHQAHQMEESLRDEALENRDLARSNVETLDLWIQRYRAEADALEAAPLKDGRFAVALVEPVTHHGVLPLADTAWLSVRDGGGIPLLPRELVSNYWRLNSVVQEANLQSHGFFHTLYEVRSLQHMHGSAMIYTPEERAQVLGRMVAMDGELRNLRSSMGYFLEVNELVLKGEKVTPAALIQNRSGALQPLPWSFLP